MPILSNSILQQAEAKIEAGVHPAQKLAYTKIVSAALKVALTGGPKGLLASLKKSAHPLEDCVQGAIGIIGLLRRESRGTMPLQAMIPATMTVVILGLDSIEKMGLMKIGPAELDQATHLLMSTIMQRLGLTPQKVQQLAEQSHGVMQDPQSISTMKQKLGAQ